MIVLLHDNLWALLIQVHKLGAVRLSVVSDEVLSNHDFCYSLSSKNGSYQAP